MVKRWPPDTARSAREFRSGGYSEVSAAETLHRLFEAQVARTPEATAVIDGNDCLTYRALNRWADHLAGQLLRLGVRPDTTVAVVLDRSVAMVAALFAVLKAGGAYVPIEADTPRARIANVLADSGAVAAFVTPTLKSFVEARGVPCPVIDGGYADGAPVDVEVDPDHLCAVYYTSGTTGRPKGVGCTHAGWVGRMLWMQRTHALHLGETVLHKTTLTFDDAAVELFWPLLTGGRVAMLAPGAHRDPRAIINAAVAYGAVHVQFVPSVLQLFLDEVTDDDLVGLAGLRTVLSSGEALRPELVRRFHARFGDEVLLENTWGTTEASIDSTRHVCRPEDAAADGGAVSLGHPIDGNEVYVLDDQFDAVADGVPGGIHVGGISLARGYLGNPRRTAESFGPHPFVPGARIYATGDRGVRWADGSFAYIDRLDRQVKVRGVRLELSEVEATLSEHPAVSDAVATTWQVAPGDTRLACYATLLPSCTATPEELHAFLAERLPSYAMPGSLHLLHALPLLPNGKLDRRSLPEPDQTSLGGSEYRPPRTTTEQALTDIWQDVLGRPRLGVHDDFFSVGGHSLLATRAVNRMRQSFDIDIPLSLMFEHATVASIAPHVERLIITSVEEMTEEEILTLAEGDTR